ncbi:hypothetical protein Fot_10503 [Forsythia ovata]|uniref:Uncharacterized protein n=1 Tax=Forsythia ovata TaxID=205694 RepID=A0ABD1WJU0_9LAMI
MALCNAENFLKDRNHYKKQTTWLQWVLNESKKKVRLLVDENDKLKKDLEAAQSDVVEFSKRCELASQAQEITAKALAEANTQRKWLLDKITQLEEMVESLRAKCYDLRGENLSLKSETRKQSQFQFTLDYENLQTFFFNFGARQVLAEVKELHPNLDLFAIEVDYPAPEEAEDGADQPPTERTEDSVDQPTTEWA